MLAREPRDLPMIVSGRLHRHQHLEWKLGQCPRWHEQEVFALDEVLDLAEESPVERVGAGMIEGKGRIHVRGFVKR